MDITQVKIFPVHEDKLKAFVSVVFDHCFMVNDIKIIQGKDGLFLSMPSRRKKSGEFKDVAHPLNNQTRRMLEERVLSEYRKVEDDVTPRRPDRESAAGAPSGAFAAVAAPGEASSAKPAPASPEPALASPEPAADAEPGPSSVPAPASASASEPAGESAGERSSSTPVRSIGTRPGRPAGQLGTDSRAPAPARPAASGAAVSGPAVSGTAGNPALPVAASAETGSHAPDTSSDEEKTLEQVQEMHLRDSFWNVS